MRGLVAPSKSTLGASHIVIQPSSSEGKYHWLLARRLHILSFSGCSHFYAFVSWGLSCGIHSRKTRPDDPISSWIDIEFKIHAILKT